MRKIREIIIHCSATPNGRHHTANDIHNWHQERRWAGIGYHEIIRADGILEHGRPHYWVGAHAKRHNNNSIGICLIGTDDFSIDQMWVLKDLILKLKVKYPDAIIIGHNEISAKTCPNFNVQEWLKCEGLL